MIYLQLAKDNGYDQALYHLNEDIRGTVHLNMFNQKYPAFKVTLSLHGKELTEYE